MSAIQEDVSTSTVLEGHASAADVWRRVVKRVREMTLRRVAFIALQIFLVTAGNAMQIIGLNFWLIRFPANNRGSFTVLAISGLLFAIFFGIMLIVYVAVKRPSLSFVWCWRGLLLICGIGLMDTLNSGIGIYAAINTPEVLQALFTSLMPLYTCVFSKWQLEDKRTYCNRWVLTSFFLMIAGVVVASATEFADTDESSLSMRMWTVLFFISIPPTSMLNVWQTKYMEHYTHTDGKGSRRPCPSHVSHRGDDTAVKLVMLFGDTLVQFLLIMVMLPADAIPWWGNSSSVSQSAQHFADGIQCIFHCPQNVYFCLVYTFGFMFTYVGSAYLNQYSATLCSMIGQLSSPLTAVLLVVVPQWNVTGGASPWYASVIAIVLLTLGAVLYSVWEEMSSMDEEREALLEGHGTLVDSPFASM